MKCGNCKNDHPHVADVRACYENSKGGTLTLLESERPKAYNEDATFRERMALANAQAKVHATDKQVAFLESLIEERMSVGEQAVALEALPKMSKAEASDLIERLLGRPKLVSDGQTGKDWPTLEELPAGWYCITTGPDAVNELAFYEVARPDKGRWEGYCFIEQVIGGNPNSRLPLSTQKGVAAKIVKAGQEQAALRYGLEIGKCCRCNRTLTNDESRAKGIGPVCEARV